MQWLAEFPYLGWSSLLLLLLALVLLVWPRLNGTRSWHRGLIVLGACGCAPFGLFSFMYIPRYWRPRLSAWFGPASPEDIMFAIATGGLAIAIVLWSLRSRLSMPKLQARDFARRYFSFALFGIAFGYALLFIFRWQIDTMLACLLAVLASASLIYRTKPELMRLSLPGLIFVPFYFLALRLAFVIWPEFVHAWDAPEQLPSWWMGVPAYELLWAAGFGTVWPLFIAWCAGLRWQEAGAAQ